MPTINEAIQTTKNGLRVLVAVLAVFGAFYAYRHLGDLIGHGQPTPPAVNPIPAPAPTPAPITPPPPSPAPQPSNGPTSARVSVNVIGPSDVIAGNTNVFHAVTTGDVKFVDWRIKPAVTGMKIEADAKVASFISQQPGEYTIAVLASGPQGQDLVMHDFVAHQATVIPQPPSPSPPQPNNPPITVDVQQATVHALENVTSQNRAAEAQIVAGIFRKTADAGGAGDLLDAARIQAQALLGDAAAGWERFFVSLALAIRTGGPIDATTLRAVADILSRVQN